MGITIKQKKLIFIILGSALLIFIFVYGVVMYYQEKDFYLSYSKKINEIMEPAQIESKNCLTGELESRYRICCAITGGIKKGLFYDCTSQEYFEPNQLVRIIFDPSKFDFNYDFYYLQTYTDLYNDDGSKITYGGFPELLDKKFPIKIVISGKTPYELELFTLLKLSVYPDVPVFDEGDEQVILYREAKIFKE